MGRSESYLGLKKIAPAEGADDNTTVDIIAIHGLETQSPRTWEFDKKDGSRVVNWLRDHDMLPAAVPEARIYTYDWNAKIFDAAPVQTLLGHADNLLALVASEQGTKPRPIIFIASCFGGLILAEAICRAAQEGSKYRQILRFTVGIVFLATPFSGTDAAGPASWLVLVRGIMGKNASNELIKDLEKRHSFVRDRVQKFAEIVNASSMRMPIRCFFETETTNIASRFLPARLSNILSRGSILVTQSSACLDGFPRQGLGRTHVMMNKFGGPGCHDFKLVKEGIQSIMNEVSITLKHRDEIAKEPHFEVPLGRNEHFIGRESILRQLLKLVRPSATNDNCQRTVIEGLGGIGKTQIALEAAYRVKEQQPDCSVFWVPATNTTSFQNAYRNIGYRLGIEGIDDDKADIKALVKAKLSCESIGSWLLIIDNVDDPKLLFTGPRLSDYFPFSRRGSILFTTRTREVTSKLGISKGHVITVAEMSDDEAIDMLRTGLTEDQTCDVESRIRLLEFLANLPLAIKQAASYMFRTGMTVRKYLDHCYSSDETKIRLLSQNFEDLTRYKSARNPVATTWLISFDHISRDCPLAAEYLKFICCLAEKDIPTSLLPPGKDELETDEAIGVLKGYAFIIERDQQDSFDIHRLIRLATRNWLRENGTWQGYIAETTRRLNEKYPAPYYANKGAWVRYLPHCQTALELEKSSEGSESLNLLTKVGDSYKVMGNYSETARIYRQELELSKLLQGREHIQTLLCMDQLAMILARAEYDRLERLRNKRLGFDEPGLGREHPETPAATNNLAKVDSKQGDYREAEEIIRLALETAERVLGKEHRSTIRIMNSLAILLGMQQKYKQAEEILGQVLELRERILGGTHPSTLSTMVALGISILGQRKAKEAQERLQQTKELTERTLGKTHPGTLNAAYNLAVSLGRQGKYKEAKEILEPVLKSMERVLGETHPHTVSAKCSLASYARKVK